MSLLVKPPLVTSLVTLRGPEYEGRVWGRAFWTAFSLQQLPHLPLAKHTVSALPGWDSLSQGEHKHEANEHFYNVQTQRCAFLLQFFFQNLSLTVLHVPQPHTLTTRQEFPLMVCCIRHM